MPKPQQAGGTMEGDIQISSKGVNTLIRQAQDIGALLVWVVYDTTTKDYPGEYVLRPTAVTGGIEVVQQYVMRRDNLNALRAMIPSHLTRLPRDEADDPVILEVWI